MENERIETSGYAEVALYVTAVVLDRLYTYQIPHSLVYEIQPGSKVIAPFGKQKLEGYVISLTNTSDVAPEKIKSLVEVLPEPPLPAEFLQLTEWMRNRYLTSYAGILKVMSPPKGKPKRVFWVHLIASPDQIRERMESLTARSFKQKQVLQWFLEHPEPLMLQDFLQATDSKRAALQPLIEHHVVELQAEDSYRSPLSNSRESLRLEPLKRVQLTEQQRSAVQEITQKINQGESGQFLLQGVTGSGKTEVYLHAIESCLKAGKSSITMVPEISLTPQLISRFHARFGDQVAVLHSRMSDGERYDEWRRIESGNARVIVGARSAVYAPCRDVGLIILDEEHESSYKQEDHPKYHAREIALFRVKYHQGVLLFGSATPSLETRYTAGKGRMKRLLLTERPSGISMPSVEIVNLCEETTEGGSVLFSQRLQEELRFRIEKGEQCILFLNRRGYASSLLCEKCGYVPTCINCAVSLTYHQSYRPRALCCHYCGYAEEASLRCPNCSSIHVKQFGMGTERIESELQILLPQARILRMDVDTTRTKGSHEQILNSFRRKEADILLGTQMIAKGHDFPNVSFVGILSADTSLYLPDVRAAERTFQLLTQVAGRAGRHLLPGKVILQTYHPDHYAITLAAKQDYEAFYAKEIIMREELKNPPYWEISIATVSHDQMNEALMVAKRITPLLQKRLAHLTTVIIHEPVPAPIERLHGKDRIHITLRYQNYREIQRELAKWYQESLKTAYQAGAFLSIDIGALWVV